MKEHRLSERIELQKLGRDESLCVQVTDTQRYTQNVPDEKWEVRRPLLAPPPAHLSRKFFTVVRVKGFGESLPVVSSSNVLPVRPRVSTPNPPPSPPY